MVRSRNGVAGCGQPGRRLGGAAGWLGAAVTAFLAAALALAATGPARADSGPVAGIGMHLATAASQASVQTFSAQYSCDFGGYGSGIAAATVPAAYAVSNSWPVNNPDDILLATDTLSLPSQVSGQLSGVTSFQVQSTVQAQQATAATVAVAGNSTETLPDPPTQVPQITSEGQVTFPAQGTGTVTLPPATFVITPFADTTAKPSITCTTTTAAQDVTITVGTATGPFYMCTIAGGGVSATESGLVNMTVTASGHRTVGATDTVTLSSTDLANLLTGLPSGITAAFSGSLPVQGAQSGSVQLTGTTTTTTAGSGPLRATGTLRLSKAGTIHLRIPQAFTITVSVQTVSVEIDCALQTSPAPTALTLSVAKRSGGSNGGGSGSSGTTEGGGTPAGAPDTGGGLGLASGDTPAAAGVGAALIAVGGGLLLWARRRRAGELMAGRSWRARRRRSS
jgi:hypothetical protein